MKRILKLALYFITGIVLLSVNSVNDDRLNVVQTQTAQSFIPYAQHPTVSVTDRLIEGRHTLQYYQYFTGTDYYFSVAGVTGNTGLSAASPWPLSKVSTTGAAGDRLLFRKGDTFTGTVTYTRSGSSGNPITFDLYGTDTNNAIIDGGGSSSSALYFNGCSYVNVSNLVIRNCSTSCEGPFNMNNCHDMTITNCYAGQGKRGMVLTYCTGNMVVTNCWFSKFSDAVKGSGTTASPYMPANGGGSAVQWQFCSGSGNKALYNKAYTDESVSTNGVGDIFSLYKCLFGTDDTFAGVGSFGMEVAYNEVRGGSSSPAGYAAVVGGDVGGGNQYIHDNIAVNPGKVGMQVQGGNNVNMSNNIIFGKSGLSYTSVGLAFGNYSGAAVSNITMGGNKINFWSGINGARFNKWWDPTSKTYPAFQPTNWTTNSADTYADPAAYDALLPDPLFADGDWNTTTTAVPAPSYSPSSNTYTKGTAISAWTPSNSGGAATSWSISPSLPAGLSFNTSTGAITGTPTAVSSATSYAVTASNASGNGGATITITVNDIAPSVSYSPTSNTYTVGTAITTWTPSNSGGTVTSWSVSPAMPSGLTFNTSTGAIIGTPSAAQSSTSYTVTASNSGGNSMPSISITINNSVPYIVIKRKIIVL